MHLWRFGKSKVCRVSWEVVDPGKTYSSSPDRGSLLAEFHLLTGRSVFLLRPSNDEARHITEGKLLHSGSTDLNVNLI